MNIVEKIHNRGLLSAFRSIAEKHRPPVEVLIGDDGHDWCGETSHAIKKFLRWEHPDLTLTRPHPNSGYYGGFYASYNCHTWVQFADGTIIDPTYPQFLHPEVWRNIDNGEGWRNYLHRCATLNVDPSNVDGFLVISPKDPRRVFYI